MRHRVNRQLPYRVRGTRRRGSFVPGGTLWIDNLLLMIDDLAECLRRGLFPAACRLRPRSSALRRPPSDRSGEKIWVPACAGMTKLGWSGTRKFLREFWFLHNIRASTNVYKIRYGHPRRRPRRDVGANERDFAKCPCTNKANCRRSFKRNVSSLKSESQAWAGGVTNGAVIRACRAKQTQFATDRPQEALAARTATVATRGGKSAKQTQLAAERREGQVLYGQRVMVNWTRKGLRRNKAN
jgi:hypothetical protein